MARTILQDRTALVLGVENAPGRACAQQLSRAGCRVILASTDDARVAALGDQLVKKKATPLELRLSDDIAAWEDQLLEARRTVQHIHLVVNALAITAPDESSRRMALDRAARTDETVARLLLGRGPLRMLTLWPAGEPHPDTASLGAWHGYVVLGPHQWSDDQAAPATEAGNPRLLRPGAIGDAVVCLLQVPPSARPTEVRLEAIASTEKDG